MRGPLLCSLFVHKRARVEKLNREKSQWESGCLARVAATVLLWAVTAAVALYVNLD